MGTRGPKPGSPRVGGRQKGTPHRRTKELAAAAEETARKIERIGAAMAAEQLH